MQTFATLCILNESILLRSVAHYAMVSHNIHYMDCLVRETKQTSIKEDDPCGDTLFDSKKKKKWFRYLLQAPNPAWGIKSLHPSDEAGDANIHPSVESVHNFVHKKITSIS